MNTDAVTHPRFAPRRGSVRLASWWAKAWLRGVEESAYAEGELRVARRLARAGGVGGISTGPGSIVAAVAERDDLWSVRVEVPMLDPSARDAFVELVAAESGRIGALLAGDLSLALAEEAEEAGVELVPYGGELGSECTCDSWTQPCSHALALLMQVSWLLDPDPLTLVLLRGLPRTDLLSRLHARTVAAPAVEGDASDPERPDSDRPDLETAYDAAARAARVLQHLEAGDVDVAHLF